MWASIPSGITIRLLLGPHSRRGRREIRLDSRDRLLLKPIEMGETDLEFASDPPRLLLPRNHRPEDALLAVRKALDRGDDLLDHHRILHARQPLRRAEVLHARPGLLFGLDRRDQPLAGACIEDRTPARVRG